VQRCGRMQFRERASADPARKSTSEAALHGGEDYELLFYVVPAGSWQNRWSERHTDRPHYSKEEGHVG